MMKLRGTPMTWPETSMSSTGCLFRDSDGKLHGNPSKLSGTGQLAVSVQCGLLLCRSGLPRLCSQTGAL